MSRKKKTHLGKLNKELLCTCTFDTYPNFCINGNILIMIVGICTKNVTIFSGIKIDRDLN
jgi:hypothetical protein